MAQIFNMPQLGSTMEEGNILRWHKREGDPVKKGEILLEIETDKASMEVEAPTDGALRKILASEGALVPIRQPIAILGTADEPIERLLAEVGAGNGSTVAQEARPAAVSSPAPTAEAATPLAGAGAGTAADSKGKVFISPRASRIADEHGVSLSALAGRGTGPEGRIIERDVRAYLEAQQARETPPAAPMEAEPARPTPRATPLAARMADELGISLEDLATGLPGSRVRSADVLRHVEAVRPTAEPAPAAAPAVPSTEGVTVPVCRNAPAHRRERRQIGLHRAPRHSDARGGHDGGGGVSQPPDSGGREGLRRAPLLYGHPHQGRCARPRRASPTQRRPDRRRDTPLRPKEHRRRGGAGGRPDRPRRPGCR